MGLGAAVALLVLVAVVGSVVLSGKVDELEGGPTPAPPAPAATTQPTPVPSADPATAPMPSPVAPAAAAPSPPPRPAPVEPAKPAPTPPAPAKPAPAKPIPVGPAVEPAPAPAPAELPVEPVPGADVPAPAPTADPTVEYAIRLTTRPAGAQVVYQGQTLGVTPMTAKIPGGQHLINVVVGEQIGEVVVDAGPDAPVYCYLFDQEQTYYGDCP
jgi:hypothetical protein